MLPTLSDKQVLDLLRKRGNLIKRPFVIGDGIALRDSRRKPGKKPFRAEINFVFLFVLKLAPACFCARVRALFIDL